MLWEQDVGGSNPLTPTIRILAHLSDLHFGRIDEALIEPLQRAIARAAPDVVVVSGDLTQRARPRQFREAAAFLYRLPEPRVVVPGNHDVRSVGIAPCADTLQIVRCAQATIDTEPAQYVSIDGEAATRTPIRASVAREALLLMAPRERSDLQ